MLIKARPYSYVILILVCLCAPLHGQKVDSLAKNLVDTLKHKLIVDDIPKKTFWDKFIYPHRWYVKQLLAHHKTDFDTTYVFSAKKKLTLTIPVAKSYYGFNVKDLSTKKTLKFSPNNYYHLGFNIGNIILNFGFYPGIKFGAKAGKGSTKSRDYQVTFIGRRVITDVNYQHYQGFYVFNASDYSVNMLNAPAVFIRPDISVFSFGVNTLFVFNFKRFSLRGAFTFTDIQRKSAGTFMAGLYHSYQLFTSSDSTLVSTKLRTDFSPQVYDITHISLITVGLSAGYGYTFVYKKIIVSSAINAGFGEQKTNYTTSDGHDHTLHINPSVHFNARGAARYDNLRFFIGIMSTYDTNYSLNPQVFNTGNYIAKLLLFSGYRFHIKRDGRKILRAMGLVDYKMR